jgi:uncharacterized protein (DUF2147 family)
MKNLRNVVVLIAISLFSLNSFAQSDVSGEYIIGEKNTVVKIEQHNGIYNGKIISSGNPNADIGKLILKELKQTEGKWKGELYSPKRERWYDAEFIPKENSLDVKIKAGFFSKTMEWIKK